MGVYDATAIEASRAVLIDALTVLGRYVDELVVVGGWVPELVFPQKGHLGSLDVDLPINPRKLEIDDAYTTIRNLLLEADYRPTERPNRFLRRVVRGGNVVEVKLDLVTGDRDALDPNRPRQIQEMAVSQLRGVDLAFDFARRLEIAGTLPEGGRNKVAVSVCDPRAFICMKGICLHERKKDKDAYDVYFTLREYAGGPEALAAAFAPAMAHPLVSEGLQKLRAKFSTMDDIGPVWAGRVEGEQGGNRETAQRDAFERADLLFRLLNVSAWRDL